MGISALSTCQPTFPEVWAGRGCGREVAAAPAFLLSSQQPEPVPVALVMIVLGVFNSLSSDLSA